MMVALNCHRTDWLGCCAQDEDLQGAGALQVAVLVNKSGTPPAHSYACMCYTLAPAHLILSLERYLFAAG